MIVSVLMPTYNRVDMLPGAIDSFLNQDYDNAKLFILNNGSTDGTADFLKQYKHHPKIEVITLSHNILPPHNFNLLLHDYAYGDLVCHLHDDDRLLPNGISLRVVKIECFMKHKVGHIMQPVVDYTIHLGQASIECRKLGMNGIEEQLMRKKLNERYGI